jgi:hypothetical protein
MTVKSEQAGWGVEGGSQKVVSDEKPSYRVKLSNGIAWGVPQNPSILVFPRIKKHVFNLCGFF